MIHPRLKRKPQKTTPKYSTITLNDFSNKPLLLIFERCCPVSLYRCRLVCRQWRQLIDNNMDEEILKQIRLAKNIRLYICDRRRAILERFQETRYSAASIGVITSSNIQTEYVEDRIAHIENSAWDYSFDLTSWSLKYDIIEVWLQNFGSFLERDRSQTISSVKQDQLNDSMSSVVSTSASAASLFEVRKKFSTFSQKTNLTEATSHVEMAPYHCLPSTQIAMTEMWPIISNFNEKIMEEIVKLSAGRFERLAEKLYTVQPLHIVFNDLSSYHMRPTILLFWFLKLLSNVRKITFDCVQGFQQVVIGRVLSVEGINELNVIQPRENPCLLIDEELLTAFLEVPRLNRRRFTLRFTGKTELTANSLLSFINKWQNHREIIVFNSIIVDAINVPPEEFIKAAALHCRTNDEAHLLSNDRKAMHAKVLVFKHMKSRSHVKYRYEDGYLIFSYCDSQEFSRRVSTKSSESESKISSSKLYRCDKSEENYRPIEMCFSPKCNNETILCRLMAFVSFFRSTA